MAAAIPPALKAADIARFAQRAGQVEKAKPVVAYWCNYYIVEQIIAKGLHQADVESKSYTMNLMDKLEQTRSDFTENDAIVDDLAGQAYVEQFGLETFQRADNAMKANKASRQTADTFQAAATFLDLNQIWGPLEPEIASKIKFAKYHSLRILKAIKAGEDPNLSNPVPEPEGPALDPDDPDVQMLNGSGDPHAQPNTDRQPSVTEIPDEHDQIQGHLAQRSTYDESLHPSRAPSVPPQPSQHNHPPPPDLGESYYHSAQPPDVSPLDSTSADRTMSDGGGYFPALPNTVRESTQPSPPIQYPASPPAVILPDSSSLPAPSSDIVGFHTSMPPRTDSLHSFPPPSMDDSNISPPKSAPAPKTSAAPPPAFTSSYPRQPAISPRPMTQATVQTPLRTTGRPVRQAEPVPAVAPPKTANEASFTADEESILKAQKHARWAISALNFEDVNTAVEELHGALESLGAR